MADPTKRSVMSANSNSVITSGNSNGGNDRQTGGIAWSGSLVGAKNPNNLGYRYSTPNKRYRVADKDQDGGEELPANMQVQFKNRQGEQVAETLDLPTNSSIDDLTALLHSLLEAGEDKRIPYSFYAKIMKKGVLDDVEVTGTLIDLLREYPISTENVLELTYQPLAVFRVRPVTRCTDTLPGHTEAVLHVSYSPNGLQLASGGGDTTVRFWDVFTSTPKHTCRGHKNHVLCTAWSPDGARFVSADRNGVVIIWDPKKGESMGQPIKAHSKWVTALAWEPMHKSAACERLATASKDGTVKLWNARTGKSTRTLSGHVDSVEAIKWGGEGLIYTASRDRTIKVWDADNGKLVRTLTGHGHRINTLALSCDYVLRTGPYDYKNKKFESTEAAFEAAKEKYEAFAKEGPERLVSGSDDFTLFLWHPIESKHPIKRLTGHQQAVNHIAFSPDGRYFASASFDKKVKIWNGFSGDFLVTLTGHVGAVYQVAWSADSRFLISASKDSTAKLWEIPSGKRAKETLPGHADEVYALDWSPNGGSVATGSKDRTIKIWKH
jgi:ribosome assembly protein 4